MPQNQGLKEKNIKPRLYTAGIKVPNTALALWNTVPYNHQVSIRQLFAEKFGLTNHATVSRHIKGQQINPHELSWLESKLSEMGYSLETINQKAG